LANFEDTRIDSHVMIVDALNLGFRYKHSGDLYFKEKYLQTVQSLAKSYKAGRVIIVADQGSSSFRRDLFPEYKRNRTFEDQTKEEKEAFEAFFNEYEATLDLLDQRYEVYRYKGVEADDLAAYIVRYRKRYNMEQIWLISSDRDWDLLVCDGVSRFSYVTRKEITVDTWPYDVAMDKYISYKCLTGDTGDNIPGIPGVGPKKATALIETYGDAFDIYEACPIDSKYKYIQNLNEHKERLMLNYELMDLITYCEEAIGESNVLDLEWRLNEKRSV
jgi:DNA polymerase-1